MEYMKNYKLSVFISLTDEKVVVNVKENHTIQDVIDAIRLYYQSQDVNLNELAFKRLGTKKFSLLFSRKGRIEINLDNAIQIRDNSLNDLPIVNRMDLDSKTKSSDPNRQESKQQENEDTIAQGNTKELLQRIKQGKKINFDELRLLNVKDFI